MRYRAICLAIVSSLAWPAGAASVDAGHALYESHCAACHGEMGMLLIPQILNARNDPNLIRKTIQTNPAMTQLSFLTDTDLANIRQYIMTPDANDADRVFNWGQATLPSLLNGTVFSGTALGYYYRYYAGTNVYVATTGDASNGGHLWFWDPSKGPKQTDLGLLLDWVNQLPAGF
jgi:cytochrome c553